MEVEVRGREHNPSFTFYQAPFPPLSTQFRPIISLYVAGNIDITGLGSAPSLPVPVGNLWQGLRHRLKKSIWAPGDRRNAEAWPDSVHPSCFSPSCPFSSLGDSDSCFGEP